MNSRKESKGFVQLEWVCPNCDGRNPGPVKTCQSCGAPQPENVQFQRPAEEKFVTDEKGVAAAKAGADIHCGFCGTRNPASAASCSQCGADLKEGKARQAGQELQAAETPKMIKCGNCNAENPSSERVCKQCGAPLGRAVPPPEPPKPAPVQPQPAAKKGVSWLVIGGVIAALILCCVASYMLFVKPAKTVTGTVSEVQWQTFVPVEQIQAVNYTNEKGSPPSDAYNVSCSDQSEEFCEEKTIDKGNGFAEVVQECHTETTTYCDYTVDQWKEIQTYNLSGTDLFPVYDDPSLTSDQRIGSSSVIFHVFLDTSEGQQTYEPGSVSEFQQFEIGSEWTIKLNAIGSVVSVEK